MHTLKPYPSYRESKVPWLGDFPTHWETERAKRLFREMERPVSSGDKVVTCFRDGAVTLRENRRVRGFTESLTEIGYQGIRQGDLVIHAMDAFAGAAGVSDSDGKGTSVYSVCVPCMDDVDVQYYAHCVREMARSHWILALSRGIRERSTDFRYSVFGAQIVPLPPPSEQSAIVRFLDHAERRIRRYIRAKEKLIALQEEQKQAIIHQAVTGRIDVRTGQPYPAYKPSGVEWLSDVPVHWFTRRLCTLASITTGKMDTVDRQDGGKYPFFVRSQNVEKIDSWSFDGEAVLTAGDGVGVGRVFHYVNGKFDYHQRVYKFSDFRDVSGQFFFEFLRAMLRFEVMQGTAKATVDSLRLPMLRNFMFVLPPLDEQSAIVHFLNESAVQTDHGIARTRREIKLLHEYRNRLIADVVTGKLDVRGTAAALPEVDPLAADDEAPDPLNADEELALDDEEAPAEVPG